MSRLDRIEKLLEELTLSQKKTDEGIKELKEAQKKTDKMLKTLSKNINGFLGNYGEAIEEHFYRSLAEVMMLGGIKFDEIRRRERYDDNSIEFDIVLRNGESVGIIEVKGKLHPKEIEGLTRDKVMGFKRDYPDESKKKIYFGIASMVTNKSMIEEAKKNEIFLITQKGNHLEVVNDKVKAR